jgi:hypothetical protein
MFQIFKRDVEAPQELKDAVILAYRKTLLERYQLDFLRQIPGLKLEAINADLIHRMRSFFLEYLYPEPEKRRILDAAFDRLRDVMSSPRKIVALLGTAGRSLFKLGSLIPAAMSAGLRTLEAVSDIRKLEGLITAGAQELSYKPAEIQQEAIFRQLIWRIPEKEIARFRRELNHLFVHLSNTELLTTTIEIMEDARNRMQEKSDLFSSAELSGVTHGLSIMHGGVDLFKELSVDQVKEVHEGINAIELFWYERIMAGQV